MAAATYAAKWQATGIGGVVVSFNEAAIDESLNMHFALPWIIGSMAPFMLVSFLGLIASKKNKRGILRAIYGSYGEMPDSFPPENWLDCRAGAGIFLRIGDVLCAKVGASIAGTVFGVCIYLLLQGQHMIIVTGMSLLSWYALSIFPKWTRSVLVRRYAFESRKGRDSKSRWQRERRLYKP